MTYDMDTKALILARTRMAAHNLAAAQDGTEEQRDSMSLLVKAFADLDNAGVFREIDEHTNYTPAEDIIAAALRAERPLVAPAEHAAHVADAAARAAESSAALYDRLSKHD